MYGSKTWTLTQSDELRLCTFEREILREIYGPVQEKGEWRMRYNQELYQLYRSPDISRTIKAGRLPWHGFYKEWEIMQCPEESCIPDSKEAGAWGELYFSEYMEGQKIWGT
jgi:hypothetical protein